MAEDGTYCRNLSIVSFDGRKKQSLPEAHMGVMAWVQRLIDHTLHPCPS
jgi:hypothetical protein